MTTTLTLDTPEARDCLARVTRLLIRLAREKKKADDGKPGKEASSAQDAPASQRDAEEI